MTTLLAKVFIVIHLVLSLVLAGLAVGIYTNRINWSGPLKPVAGQAAQGELAKHKDEFEHWLPLATGARQDWDKETEGLLAVEKQRPADQKWYTDQLAILVGKYANGAPAPAGPVTQIAHDPKGQLEVDNNGHPKLRPINLKSRQTYVRDLLSTRKKIDGQITAIAALQERQEALTKEINGVEGKTRGLRNLITEAKQVGKNAEAEVRYLDPFLINRLVEGQLLGKRREGLEARVKLLQEKTGVAARRP